MAALLPRACSSPSWSTWLSHTRLQALLSSVPHSAGFSLSFPFSWSPSSQCNMCTFAGIHPGPFLLLTAYRYLVPASWALKKKPLIFFLSFHHPFVASFFEVKSVAHAISKLDITRDDLKLLIHLPLSVSSVHHHTWSQSCSLKSLWTVVW